jgi:uncharacterized protein YggU (UPF0235/DUF167 family)
MIQFNVHVHPGSRTTSVGGSHDGSLRVHVNARAIDGAATKDVLAALAQAFDVRAGAVTCVRGTFSREKSIVIDGNDEDLARQLQHLLTLTQ